ncbi:hypothetical protein DORFOR_01653 [Dorea formicigenerans ATCC 27755]|uniref:Uncharacterized protein n=1 Tax=Dorea formicigenerans ATCC 27755 TaxID=411461 RepID=B0G5W2_9FIRM|nr:hypothetical protein DORFOR_01653 [Dorea formicigenerans ATCC 27755]
MIILYLIICILKENVWSVLYQTKNVYFRGHKMVHKYGFSLVILL